VAEVTLTCKESSTTFFSKEAS